MGHEWVSRIVTSPASCIILSIADCVTLLLLLQTDIVEFYFVVLLLTLKSKEETVGCRGIMMKQQHVPNNTLNYNWSHFQCNIWGKTWPSINVSQEYLLSVRSSSGPEWPEKGELTSLLASLVKQTQMQKGCLGLKLSQPDFKADRLAKVKLFLFFNLSGSFWLCEHLTSPKNSARITLFNLIFYSQTSQKVFYI